MAVQKNINTNADENSTGNKESADTLSVAFSIGVHDLGTAAEDIDKANKKDEQNKDVSYLTQQ